ncbi:MAG TPA: hypothetical protein VI358_09060 [Pseudolabrys sp.]
MLLHCCSCSKKPQSSDCSDRRDAWLFHRDFQSLRGLASGARVKIRRGLSGTLGTMAHLVSATSPRLCGIAAGLRKIMGRGCGATAAALRFILARFVVPAFYPNFRKGVWSSRGMVVAFAEARPPFLRLELLDLDREPLFNLNARLAAAFRAISILLCCHCV